MRGADRYRAENMDCRYIEHGGRRPASPSSAEASFCRWRNFYVHTHFVVPSIPHFALFHCRRTFADILAAVNRASHRTLHGRIRRCCVADASMGGAF